MAKTFVLSEAKARELDDLIAWKKSISGPGVHSTARTLLIRQPVVRQRSAPAAPVTPALKAFRITNAERDGSAFRWFYTGTEVEKTSEGYGGWTDKANGLADQALFSTLEDQQTTPTTATGTDTSGPDFPSGVTPQPLQVGTRVWCQRVKVGNVDEYWIVNIPSGFDGTCEAEE